MEYMSDEMVRWSFGFANPNHAAAAICALFPFCWGWCGKWRWAGRLIGIALCVMLAMTYSRTGFVVLVIEAAVLWWRGALGSAHPTVVHLRRAGVSAPYEQIQGAYLTDRAKYGNMNHKKQARGGLGGDRRGLFDIKIRDRSC